MPRVFILLPYCPCWETIFFWWILPSTSLPAATVSTAAVLYLCLRVQVCPCWARSSNIRWPGDWKIFLCGDRAEGDITVYITAQCQLIPLIVTFTLAEIFDLLADTFFWISSFAAPFRLPFSRPCSALATDFSQFALQSSLSDVLRIKKIIFINLIFKCFHIQGS